MANLVVNGVTVIDLHPVVDASSITTFGFMGMKLFYSMGSGGQPTNPTLPIVTEKNNSVKMNYSKISKLTVVTQSTTGQGENLLTVQYWG